MIRGNIISATEGRIPRKKIAALLAAISKGEKVRSTTVNIVFVEDREIKKLNRKYRRLNQATDVLSFNIDDVSGRDSILGEIYISLETAGKYAGKDGISLTAEILGLCCHGALHLLGYDHIRERDRSDMKSRERHYLGKLK
jgi:probable rRNA maturation factor